MLKRPQEMELRFQKQAFNRKERELKNMDRATEEKGLIASYKLSKVNKSCESSLF